MTQPVRIAMAQIDCTVGDIGGNAAKIIAYARRAAAEGADIVITPEQALGGYPAEDLWLREEFYRACEDALRNIAAETGDIHVLVGYPARDAGRRYNAASWLHQGRVLGTYHKQNLPNYTVFDEVRYFSPGDQPLVIEVKGVRFGVNICADVWKPEAVACACGAGADALLILNASPYHMQKQRSRVDIVGERVATHGIPAFYTNLVGGQDELVFDGGSFAMDAQGEVQHQSVLFDETLDIVTLENGRITGGRSAPPLSLEAEVYRALTIGVRDYIGKNGFPGILLGLSGGIDSALTLAIAVDALGADRVTAVMMPSEFTASMSLEDAREMARIHGVDYHEIAIAPTVAGFNAALAPLFAGRAHDLTEENIQARVRGTLLMALSNKFGSIVLTTGNKSEMAVGYATLYGDMAGGFAVLKDVPKTLVYKLSNYRNTLSRVIPERVIMRPPSAELRADQKDQDSLPAYETLDAIIEAYVEGDACPDEMVEMGLSREDVRRVVTLIDRNEYKRRQAPVGVRITQRGFGKDRRYPITSKFEPRC